MDRNISQEPFNSAASTIMHIDLNSCFAAIEQQANPLIRGRPTVVAAYTTERGCILAASVEAKRVGIKTGMRVSDAKSLYSSLVVLPPDPEKYRWVNHKLQGFLASYTPHLSVESIDEVVLNLDRTPVLEDRVRYLIQDFSVHKVHGYIATLLHGYKTNNETMQQCNSTYAP